MCRIKKLLTHSSCSTTWSYYQPRCNQQRYPGSCGRHFICRSTGNHCKNDLCTDTPLPNNSADQALLWSNLGYIYWCSHTLRLFLFSIWLACPWKGHPACYNPFQPSRPQGPPLPWCLPTTRRGRACFTLSTSLHRGWISYQDDLYDILARLVLTSIWSSSAGVGGKEDFPFWSIQSALHHSLDTADRVLFPVARNHLWKELRVLTINVYQLLFGGGSCGKLDWVSGCVFYVDDTHGCQSAAIAPAFQCYTITTWPIIYAYALLCRSSISCLKWYRAYRKVQNYQTSGIADNMW